MVPMPEASVDEQGYFPPSKNKIGLTSKIGSMKPKPQSQPVRGTPYVEFGHGVLRPDLRHGPRAMGSIAIPRPAQRRSAARLVSR
jgi:hypothetical protein